MLAHATPDKAIIAATAKAVFSHSRLFLSLNNFVSAINKIVSLINSNKLN